MDRVPAHRSVVHVRPGRSDVADRPWSRPSWPSGRAAVRGNRTDTEGGTVIGPVETDDTGHLVAGRFELREQLGAGGMAEVHRATDRQLGRDVAVKLVDLRTDIDGAARTRVSREARRAARLRHPHVVQVHDVGEDEGHAYIVMEHIDGPSLRDVRDERGPLPEHEVASIGVQVCEALQAAHDAGIVHRDVKPANILLEDGQVKVTDFGIARAVGDTLTDDVVRGTIGYLAPEQVSGAEVDHRADVYALGIVLYELAAGTRPFDAGTATEAMYQRLHSDPPPPSAFARVSPEFDHVIGRALSRDPEERFGSAGELRDALEPLTVDPMAETQPLSHAIPPGADAPADADGSAGTDRRSRWWVLAALLGVLSLGLAAVAFGPQLWGGGSVTVPDLTGATVRGAAAILEQHDLEVGEIRRRPSDRPDGTVIGQVPGPADAPPDDGTVDLIVAADEPSSPSPSPAETDPAGGDPAEQPATDGGQPPPPDDGGGDPDGGSGGPPDDRGPDGQGPPGQDGGGPPGRN